MSEVKRKKLSLAGVTPEQRAIINSQDPPLPGEASVAVAEPEVEEPAPKEAPVADTKPAKRRPRRQKPKEEPQAADSPLVTQTFRIPENYAEALLRASMERKLKKEKPFTQQDIVTQALGAWLAQEGYL